MSPDLRLVAPVNDHSADAAATTFEWAAGRLASQYRIQVARDAAFHDIVFDAQLPSTTLFTLFNGLRPRVEAYFWRLQAAANGEWTEPASFRAVAEVESAPRTAAPAAPRPVMAPAAGPRPAAPRVVAAPDAVMAPYLTETTPAGLSMAVMIIVLVMMVVIGIFAGMGNVW